MATSVIATHVFGTKDVASAGTALILDATNYELSSLMIIAHNDNTGQIYYGGSDVDSSTQRGLDAGESIVLGMSRTPIVLNTVYIDAGTTNDGVDFVGVRL